MTGTTTIRVNARARMRELAADIVIARCALRHARTPELVRSLAHQLANLTYAWRLLRKHD